MNWELLNTILNFLLTLCAPIAVASIVPFMVLMTVKKWKEIDHALTDKYGAEWLLVKDIVVEAVHYAEQKGMVSDLENLAAEKQKWAIEFVEAALKTRGINIDLYPIIEMIEAAVMEEFNKDIVLEAKFAKTHIPCNCNTPKV